MTSELRRCTRSARTAAERRGTGTEPRYGRARGSRECDQPGSRRGSSGWPCTPARLTEGPVTHGERHAAVQPTDSRLSSYTRVIRVVSAFLRAVLGRCRDAQLPLSVCSAPGSGQVRYSLGDRLVDRYLEFVAGRAPAGHAAGGGLRSEGVLHGDREGPGGDHCGGCVRFPRPPAWGPQCGAARGPGVGAVGADDRAAVAVGVGPVCLSGRPGGYAGAGQPGAAGGC